MLSYTDILYNKLYEVKEWSLLKERLSENNTHNTEGVAKDTTAGKIFEYFAKYYFKVHFKENGIYRNVWLFNEVPLDIRNKLNVKGQDYGVDLILETQEGLLYVVQCKFKNNESSSLSWSRDKIANLFAFCPNADGYIVFSNASKIDVVSRTRHENFYFYSVSDLIELDALFFNSMRNFIECGKAKSRVFFKPKDHQREAIDSCIKGFENASRGQLILPCGAGKTLTSLWIKESLNAQITLVLVPSLALLRQIKGEWSAQRKNYYRYICVCSEKDIDKDNVDQTTTHLYEVDVNVTTDPCIIKRFLTSDDENKVLFSTYHSLDRIADAIYDTNFEFDYIFCDEAHKTAGVGVNKFSLVHDNERIPSKRRLYATATPRIVKESIKKKLTDDLAYAYDMNDPTVFGEEFYRMSFKKAIEQDILVDYKIVVIGVSDKRLEEHIKARQYVSKDYTIDDIANSYALDQVMNEYGASHAITFHSRVKTAREFSSRHSMLLGDVCCNSVSGDQSTTERSLILNQFKTSPKAIVSNARCLTEGVDVPAIDLVYFCDPKNSKIDIVQASGRALRKKEGKKQGLIVVPIYHSDAYDVETAISQSAFKNLIQVVRALCDQDERLQDEISSIASGKGERLKRLDISSLGINDSEGRIILEGFETNLREALFSQIIEKSSSAWELRFIELKEYIAIYNCYPTKSENKELYQWIALQRNLRTNNNLSRSRISRLNEISFIWDMREQKWDERFNQLKQLAQQGNYEPNKFNASEDLVVWWKIQKDQIANNSIGKDRLILLSPYIDQLTLDITDYNWQQLYKDLIQFRNEVNNTRWPQYDRDNTKSRESKLSNFCQTIRSRYKKDDLKEVWFEKMMDISFNFESKTNAWNKRYLQVKAKVESTLDISVDAIGAKDNNWIYRHKKLLDEGKLSSEQAKLIKELNLDLFYENWDVKFKRASKWFLDNSKISTNSTNKELSSWFASQRSIFRKGKLSEEQIQKLESIGYDLYTRGNERRDEKWRDKYNELKEFIDINRRYPLYISDGKEKVLYLWCQAQRQAQAGTALKRRILDQWKVDLLNDINFTWSLDDKWDRMYQELKDIVESERYEELSSSSEGVGRWLYNQKRRLKIKGIEYPERVKRLKELDIDLESDDLFNRKKSWNVRFKELCEVVNTGKLNTLSSDSGIGRWLYNQSYMARTGSYPLDKVEQFKVLGIDILTYFERR